MGARHVAAVFSRWGGDLDNGKSLSRPAFRLLVHMAQTAKDADDPPTYFGGREHLAFGLGRKVPPGRSDEDRRTRDATWRAINRAIAQLMTAGALHDRDHPLAQRPAPNHRPARYVLNLGNAGRPASCEQPENGGHPASPVEGYAGHPVSSERRTPGVSNAGRGASERRTSGGGTQDAPRPPQEEEEVRGITGGLDDDPAAQGLGRARDDRARDDDDTLTTDTQSSAEANPDDVAAPVPEQHHAFDGDPAGLACRRCHRPRNSPRHKIAS